MFIRCFLEKKIFSAIPKVFSQASTDWKKEVRQRFGSCSEKAIILVINELSNKTYHTTLYQLWNENLFLVCQF